MLSSSLRWKRKSKFSAKQIGIIAALLIVSLLPIAFKKSGHIKKNESHRTLTIITSHNETIRREFERAFAVWWRDAHRGELIHINWVTPGGGAEVRKVMDTKFEAFQKNKGEDGVENVGLDVFFGGGAYEFDQAKRNGYLVKIEAFETLRGIFIPDASGDASIPQKAFGETFYDKDHQWVGVCLSSFGICYNKDVLKRLGFKEDEHPTTWDDLADPRFYKNIALADPTKSGSVTKAFEMILQQKMQEHIAANKVPNPAESKEQHRDRILNEGWRNGMMLIQKITANARYFSDSATKIPHDVANGDAAVGMCIDFYGRTYNSKYMKEDGTSRIEFIIPKKGSSLTVDPVAVFKNAAEPELAQAFVEFCLRAQGQILWNGDPKLAGKFKFVPHNSALRRLPVSKDYYTPNFLMQFTDPEVMPYAREDILTYDSELTGPAFNALRVIIRVMAIDTHEELTEAWKAMIETGMPRDIMEHHFHSLSKVSYTKAVKDIGAKIHKMKMKRVLSARLRDLEKYAFNAERIKHHYPELEAEKYAATIEKLKKDVAALKSFDVMTLERQQQDLARQFRLSYEKAIKNAGKL